MKLPKNMGLIIQHNEHKIIYCSIKEYFNTYAYFSESDISPDEYEKCQELDELWSIRWYPITPISFYIVFASTLEKCLELANEEKDG